MIHENASRIELRDVDVTSEYYVWSSQSTT